MKNNKYYNYKTLFSVVLSLLFLWILLSESGPIKSLRNSLEQAVVYYHSSSYTEKNDKAQELTIIYIDKQSLAKHGPWPWSGRQFKTLLNRLINNGVSVIAFDLPMSLHQENSAQQVYDWLIKNRSMTSKTKRSLRRAILYFDYNSKLATRLKQQNQQQNIILGIKFTYDSIPSTGYLPKPIQFSNQISRRSVPTASSYIGNFPNIQDSRLRGGFTNLNPVQKGMLYRTPLLIQYGGRVFPSLALQLARNRLLTGKIYLRSTDYDADYITGINLDESWIPTDRHANIVFRFRGPPDTFPSLSASKVISGKLSQEIITSHIKNKAIIISSNVPQIRNLIRIDSKHSYTSAEIHANIVSSILTKQMYTGARYLKHLDAWLLVFTGLILTLLLPGMNSRQIILTGSLFCISWFSYHAILISNSLYISTLVVPLLLILVLSLFHYLANLDSVKLRMLSLLRLLQDLIPVFSSSEQIDDKEQIKLQHSTVMFVHLRNFSILSEQVNEVDLNKLLGIFSTPISSVIMRHGGQITQHIGHSILATWTNRSNLTETMNSTIDAALNIQRIAKNLQSKTIKKGLPALDINIGINSGTIKTRSLTWQSRLTCGQAVDSAWQLSTLCEFYGVNVIVSSTARHTSPDFYYRQLDIIKVSGRAIPLTIYEPISRTSDVDLCEYYELQLFERAMEYIQESNREHAISFFSYLHKARPNIVVYKRYLDELNNNTLGDKGLEHNFLNKRVIS